MFVFGHILIASLNITFTSYGTIALIHRKYLPLASNIQGDSIWSHGNRSNWWYYCVFSTQEKGSKRTKRNDSKWKSLCEKQGKCLESNKNEVGGAVTNNMVLSKNNNCWSTISFEHYFYEIEIRMIESITFFNSRFSNWPLFNIWFKLLKSTQKSELNLKPRIAHK